MNLSNSLLEFLGQSFVLVIEPNANYRLALKSFLSKLKVKDICFVATVGEAKREMLTKKIGLFVVEWQLPDKNGLQLCRELRKDKRYKSTPFLLLGKENLREDVILASEGGISSYLLKPFSYKDFCTQLTQILNNENNPSQIQSLLDRADTFYDEKEYWVAEALYREALKLRPSSARATCGLGKIELANNNNESALEYFKQAVAANSEFVEGYKFILSIAEATSDTKAVIETASILHQISPENPRYPLLIASAHMELGNFNESEEFFLKTVRLSPKLAEGYRGLGYLYLKTKEYEKAQRNLELALDLDQGDVSTLNSLGLAYVRQNMLDEGIKKYRLALSIDGQDCRVLFNLGLALEQKNKLAEARDALMRAVAADPGFEKAKRNLARIAKLLSGKSDTYQPTRVDTDESNLDKKGA